MRKSHGTSSAILAKNRTLSDSQKEAEFNFGVFYRTIEEHIESFAAQASCTLTLADIADRVGTLLRLKAENVRTQSGVTELLHQMRTNSASTSERAGHQAGLATREAIHVRSRTGRTLSAAARRKIGAAVKARWAQKRALKRRQGKKRKLSTKQLRAMRENIAKGRAKRLAAMKVAA